MSLTVVSLEPTALFGAQEPLRQLALMSLRNSQDREFEVSVQVNTVEGESASSDVYKVGIGDHQIRVWVPDIEKSTVLSVTVRDGNSGEALTEFRTEWQPQRKWKIYLIKASHYDLGYDGRVDHMQREAAQYMDLAKRLCEDHSQLHEWHYYLEHMGFMRAYERERKESELREFVERYLKTGMMTLMGNPSGPHWHWMDYEQIARSGYPARRDMKDRFGLDVKTIAVIDNPSASWSAYQAFAQSGFKYALRFAQPFRGPGALSNLGYPRLFYLVAPNGRDRILCHFSEFYGESLWVGQAGGNGEKEYIDAAGFSVSRFLKKLESGKSWGDYPYDTFIMPNYLDWEIPHEDERVNIHWRKAWKYPQIVYSDAAEGLAHMESTYGEQIPVLRGDTNNYSSDYTSIDPRSQGLKRKASRMLPFAEGLAVVASSLTNRFYPAKAFNRLYIDLVEYDEHCWPTMLPGSDMNIFNTSIVKTHSANRFHQAIEEHVHGALKALNSQSDNAQDIITVWNSLAHPKRDLVNVQVPEQIYLQLQSKTSHVRDEATGEICQVQLLEEHRIAFVAAPVPAYGYKRYGIVRVKPGELNESSLVQVFESEGIFVLESPFYRIEAEQGSGRVVSLLDKKQKRSLLDPSSPHLFNQWLRVRGKEFQYDKRSNEIEISTIGTTEFALGACGPVFAELCMIIKDEEAGAEIRSKLIVYAEFDRIDLVNEAVRMDFLHTPVKDRYKENIFISFPFLVDKPDFYAEYAPGVVHPVQDALPSVRDFTTVNRWIDINNGEYGITVVPHEAATFHLGQVMYNQFDSAYVPEQSHLYSYAWSNRMSGLTTLSLDDYKAKLSYTIRSHQGDWSEGGAPELGWGQAGPLMAYYGETPADALPESLLSLDQSNVQLTVLKRSEQQGGGYIARLVETYGVPATTVRLHVRFVSISKAWLCNLIEEDQHELEVTDSHTIQCTIGSFDMATIRFETVESKMGAISNIVAVAMNDSQIQVTWDEPEAHGFNVYRSEDSEFVPTVHNLVAYVETNSYLDQSLKPGTIYYYRVAPADRHNHQGEVSQLVSVRTELKNVTPPAMLDEVGVVPMDWDRLTVYWRKSVEPDIALYEVYRSSKAEFALEEAEQVATVENDGYWYQLYADTNVKPGETWFYRILPVDYAGNIQQASICVSGKTPMQKRLSEKR